MLYLILTLMLGVGHEVVKLNVEFILYMLFGILVLDKVLYGLVLEYHKSWIVSLDLF